MTSASVAMDSTKCHICIILRNLDVGNECIYTYISECNAFIGVQHLATDEICMYVGMYICISAYI